MIEGSDTEKVELDVNNLIAIQRDLLISLADIEEASGSEVQDRVSELRGEEVSRGKLYPNLNSLEEEGWISKTPRNKRAYELSLTYEGRVAVKRHAVLWRDIALGRRQ